MGGKQSASGRISLTWSSWFQGLVLAVAVAFPAAAADGVGAVEANQAASAAASAAGEESQVAQALICVDGKDALGKQCATPAGTLYPPAAQLDSWPMRVFVSRDLPPGSNPRLRLYFADGLVKEPKFCEVKPHSVARNQAWTGGADIDGQSSQHVGTWLLFDLKPSEAERGSKQEGSNRPLFDCTVPGLKSVARVQAVLEWTDARTCGECRLFSPLNYVYLGTAWKASLYALAILVAFTGLVALLLKVSKSSFRNFLLVDFRWSLALLQMLVWTGAVGYMVLYQLLVSFDGASIPESLIVLMGTSLLTTGAATVLGQSAKQSLQALLTRLRNALPATGASALDIASTKLLLASIEAQVAASPLTTELTVAVKALETEIQSRLTAATVAAATDPLAAQTAVDTITQTLAELSVRVALLPDATAKRTFGQRVIELLTADGDVPNGQTLSLSRLQMLFWTGVIIVMFISKSIVAGALWDIPWTLVALMGVSQLGYVGGKLAPSGLPGVK